MGRINSIYAECCGPIWDYYFRQDNLVFHPCVLIGEKRQKEYSELNNVKFICRADANNLNVTFNYLLSDTEIEILGKILTSNILYKMFYRNSIDSEINERTYTNLVQKYSEMWFWLINENKLKTLILHEMPHLPYTYIGYLIFRHLGLKTYFTATLPLKDKTYFVDKIERYSIFTDCQSSLLNRTKSSSEELLYLSKIKEKYRINPSIKPKIRISIIRSTLINLRNFIFPSSSKRLNFNTIHNGNFVYLKDRIYYYYILINTIKKFIRSIYYNMIIKDYKEEKKIKVLFALQFEPELAVYPLAGELNDQYEAITELSKKLEDKGIIYVKEHPWMFDYSKIKGIVRKRSFYTNLSKLDNIRFINYTYPINDLLDKMDIICTLTGTIGWEAFTKKIPVIYYGYPWYAGLPGTRKIDYVSDIENYLQEARSEYSRTSFEKVYEKLNSSIYDFSVKMKNKSDSSFIKKAELLKSSLEYKNTH